jgi:hypothetical protein
MRGTGSGSRNSPFIQTVLLFNQKNIAMVPTAIPCFFMIQALKVKTLG